MRFVKIAKTDEPRGYFLSAREYLGQLPDLQAGLPSGAWSFASDPAHYDFYSERCVKDLRLVALTTTEGSGGISVSARYRFNAVAPEHLLIQYVGVSQICVMTGVESKSVEPGETAYHLGLLQLDEILPNEHGCEHEIGFIGGTIRIVCADLDARWVARTLAD